jgi:acetyltransferase-like isoleucine patch superfamily enzyme
MKIKFLPKYIYTIIKLVIHGVKFNYKVLGNSFYINNKGQINLGSSVYLTSFPNGTIYRTALSTYYPEALLTIGNNCNINGTVIHCNEKVTIGNFCMFGPGTVICDNDSHRIVLNREIRNSKALSKPIVIKDNVWIGMNCLIMKGVTIGANSIVAAGSIVTKDIPNNCLFGGNPAKLIKELTE